MCFVLQMLEDGLHNELLGMIQFSGFFFFLLFFFPKKGSFQRSLRTTSVFECFYLVIYFLPIFTSIFFRNFGSIVEFLFVRRHAYIDLFRQQFFPDCFFFFSFVIFSNTVYSRVHNDCARMSRHSSDLGRDLLRLANFKC